MLSTVYKNVLCGASTQSNFRHFYGWLIIMFNSVDDNRLKQVGPDRLCAEWLLRNGAGVKWNGLRQYLRDYNSLPPENEKFLLNGVDATDSAIHHIGFPHFACCKHLEEIKLVRCSYVQNEALPLLGLVKDTLHHLEVVECKNITDEGLLSLKGLTNLKSLKLGGFPYIEDAMKVKEDLIRALPNCKVDYNEPCVESAQS